MATIPDFRPNEYFGGFARGGYDVRAFYRVERQDGERPKGMLYATLTQGETVHLVQVPAISTPFTAAEPVEADKAALEKKVSATITSLRANRAPDLRS